MITQFRSHRLEFGLLLRWRNVGERIREMPASTPAGEHRISRVLTGPSLIHCRHGRRKVAAIANHGLTVILIHMRHSLKCGMQSEGRDWF